MSIKISTISHATENEKRVLGAMLHLCQEGLRGKIVITRIKGHYGNDIALLLINVRDATNSDVFFSNFWSRLSPGERTEVESKITSLTDSAGTLHVRVGKQESLKGTVKLRDSDPIKVEIQFMARGLSGASLVEAIRRRISLVNDECED